MMGNYRIYSVWATTIFALSICSGLSGGAQNENEAVAAGDAKLSEEELDQLLASIALYPDALLTQIFMAATYPLEVVEAERWVKRNTELSGDALTSALETQNWDPSVKSLVNFPDVLTMMSEELDWTTRLGDAFLSQQKEVLAAVQKLRAKAREQGNLETTKEQIVKVEPSPTVAGSTNIIIEPASTEVVYVPTYDPVTIYGAWWWPSYPPHYYYPPGYVARPGLWFGAGVACGLAWGYAWGNCNWNRGEIDIDMNRNTFVNNKIDRSRYREGNVFQGDKGRWQHNPTHRQGTPYRDQQVARKYNKPTTAEASQAREAFRGRADAGRQDLARGGADQFRGGAAGQRPTQNRAAQTGERRGAQDRSGQRSNASQNRQPSGNRPTPSANRGGAFNSGQSGQAARQQSRRGQQSRASTTRPSGGGSRPPAHSGGAPRGGGGGRRR